MSEEKGASRIVIHRRNRVDQYTAAEKAISDAVQAVEAAGAHPRLTDAVNLLLDAQDAVADFVDGIVTSSRRSAAPVVPYVHVTLESGAKPETIAAMGIAIAGAIKVAQKHDSNAKETSGSPAPTVSVPRWAVDMGIAAINALENPTATQIEARCVMYDALAAPEPPPPTFPARRDTLRLTRKEFENLQKYSCSLPTGKTIGKRWRRKKDYYDASKGWVVGEYISHTEPNTTGIKWWEVEIIPEPEAQTQEGGA